VEIIPSGLNNLDKLLMDDASMRASHVVYERC